MPSRPRKTTEPAARRKGIPLKPPAVNVLPDAALQFVPALEDIPNKPPSFVADTLAGIREALGADVDVHYGAFNLTDGPGRIGTLGMWFTPSKSVLDNLTRADSLKFVKRLDRQGNTWFYINSNFMNRSAQQAFDAQPHRLKPDGKADPKGPIHISRPSLSFEKPARVVTSVPGVDERPLPDVKFTIRLIDDLSVSQDQIVCTSETKLDKDTGLLDALTVAGFLSVIPATGVFFLIERIRAGRASAPKTPPGAGAQAAQLIPSQIMLPGGKKLAVVYISIQADETGLKTSGGQDTVDRVPSLRIVGPTALKIGKLNSASGKYRIEAIDLRGDLKVHWSVGNGSATPQKESTTVRIGRGSAQPGTSFKRTIRVTATDADGLTASASTTVRITVPDAADDDGPTGKPGDPRNPPAKRRAAP